MVESTTYINSIVDIIKDLLTEGYDINISKLGTFHIKDRASRKGTNPFTGKEMIIPAKKTISFKASIALKDDMQV